MSFTIQGWCPGALRPMDSGDGLVVRVRPPGGRLTPAQAAGIAAAARAHGNGLIDLSARANVQLRGVTPASHPALIADLGALDLIDPDPATEARRNITVTPFADAQADRLAATLAAALAKAALPLPGKFGFAIDTGPAPVLGATAADIRLERGPAGLILRAEGCAEGRPVTEAEAPGAALDLARWFLAEGGVTDGRGRMAALIARGARPPGASVPPAPALAPPGPGLTKRGALVGFAFGQMQAETLAALAALGAIRVTPWRMLLIEGLKALPDLPDLLTDPADPLGRVIACTGAPGCPQAHRPTRPLARRLAPAVPPGAILHVSGCAKGCAHPGPATITLTATPRGFDRAENARAGDAPVARDLPDTLTLKAPMPHRYETDGAAIYRASFAIIRAEADLARFTPDEEPVVVRMIHAAGLVGLERDVAFSPGMAAAARAALAAGAPILCDARMVSEGITRARLPADNRVICTLNDPRVPDLARAMGNTRSAAAVELWRPDLAGAVVAIGNAPTALFHLLNMLQDPACPRPAAIIGCPVGFVGAAESKAALIAAPPAPALVVRGRLGGSAITVAALNALASRKEA